MTSSPFELARQGQACIVASLIMAGASGPVTLAGVLALQKAEVLTGIALTQRLREGAPEVYGTTSSAMDMKTGTPSIGSLSRLPQAWSECHTPYLRYIRLLHRYEF
jgi:trimethylamine---corrinoid protein Co-methyltransferase